jgi:hypothetical protein
MIQIIILTIKNKFGGKIIMEKQKLYIGNMFEGIELSFDKLYYTESIQNAIGSSLEYLNCNKELSKCVKFVENNSDLKSFIVIAVKNNTSKFQTKKDADNIIKEYTKKCFKNVTDEMLKQIDKKAMAASAFQDLIAQKFLKVKPLMEDLESKIYDVLK